MSDDHTLRTPAAPTNVVITTSDKVPTTAPPMVSLPSITVPPQHRLGVKPQPPPVQPPPAPGTPNSSTHSYQMAMPKVTAISLRFSVYLAFEMIH